MLAAITPSIDNDFFVAVQENSIFLPINLNEKNIKTISEFEYIDSTGKGLTELFSERGAIILHDEYEDRLKAKKS